MISVAAGGRYIYAVNTYEGAIKNIQINPTFGSSFDGSYISAVGFFTALGKAEEAAMVSDQIVDAKQTGSGFTPILSANISPMDNLNIAVRYEFNTALELTNETTADSTGLFPDGVTSNNDIPAILTLGAGYAFSPALSASISYSNYFDKNANWDGDEELVDKNFYEIAGAVEYKVTPGFLLSLGFVKSTTGVTADYQTDISHSLSSNSIAGGAAVKLNDSMALQLGASYTMYDEFTKEFADPLLGTYSEKYNRSTLTFAIGLDYHL